MIVGEISRPGEGELMLIRAFFSPLNILKSLRVPFSGASS